MIKKLNIYTTLIFLSIALFPIYLFPSGQLQLSHIGLLIASIIIILFKKIRITNWLLVFFLFCLYALIIDSWYSLSENNIEQVKESIYFIFNFIIVISIYNYSKNYGSKSILYGAIAALMIGAAVAFSGKPSFISGESSRIIGGFNNPNQLGFFSVSIFSLIYIAYKERYINYILYITLSMICIILAILSLSKAAMIAIFLCLPFTIRIGIKNLGIKIALWSCIIVSLFFLVNYFTNSPYLENYAFYNRISNMQHEDDSSAAARGYFAFLDAKGLQMIFGMGGADIERVIGHEVHSTFGSVFNRYGIIGITLFMYIFLVWIYKVFRYYKINGTIVLVMPSILYGLTHNGSRFTIFWILFTVSLALSKKNFKYRIGI